MSLSIPLFLSAVFLGLLGGVRCGGVIDLGNANFDQVSSFLPSEIEIT